MFSGTHPASSSWFTQRPLSKLSFNVFVLSAVAFCESYRFGVEVFRRGCVSTTSLRLVDGASRRTKGVRLRHGCGYRHFISGATKASLTASKEILFARSRLRGGVKIYTPITVTSHDNFVYIRSRNRNGVFIVKKGAKLYKWCVGVVYWSCLQYAKYMIKMELTFLNQAESA